MSVVRRVAKNTGVIIVGHIINALAGLAIVALLARHLGPTGFGLYNFVFFFLSFFGVIANLGIDTILVREIARGRRRADLLLGNAILMKLVLSLLAIVLGGLTILLMGYPFDTVKLTWVASLGLLLSFGSLYEVTFQVDLKMEYPTVVRFAGKLVLVVLLLLVILLKGSLIHLVIVTVVANIPTLLLMGYFSGKLIRPKFEVDIALWKRLLDEAWPVGLIAFLSVIYVRIDVVMLSLMKGNEAVGLYSAAVKLVESLGVVPAAFMMSIFPLMARYHQTSKESLIQSYKLSFRYLMMIIIPIAVGTTLLANQIIFRFYGARFSPSSLALAVLIWSEVAIFGVIVIGNVLISTNKQRVVLVFSLFVAVANITLNLFLIPAYSFIGAAYATSVSYAAGIALMIFLNDSRIYSVEMLKSSFKPVVAASVMGVVVYFIPWPLLAVFVGAVIYFMTMLAIKGINSQDIKFIREIISAPPSQKATPKSIGADECEKDNPPKL